MHNPFDQLAKKIGKQALDASGTTIVHHEISRDAQHADLLHDPDPTRGAQRDRLGLLGRLAEALCLIEVFGHAPDGAELRACLAKHFAHWDEREKRTHASNKRRRQKQLPPEPMVEPFLWIIAAVASAPMLRKLEVKPAPSYPRGVYHLGGDLFRVGIVVASELPHDRFTLLVRIMAAGAGLPRAITELGALPEDAPERIVADEVLEALQDQLVRKPNRTPEEEEFVVRVMTTFKGEREEGRKEGRKEGEAAGHAQSLLTVFRVRGIAVPDASRERILAEMDPEQLERWLERAILAASVAEVMDEPS